MAQYNVSFAGAGRVAGALCREMHCRGININQIISETGKDGKPLAGECKASWSSDLIFNDPADIIIVAVPDHKLYHVLNTIRCPANTIVAHTAGSFGLDLFPDRIKHKGVFYPLQTFSKGRKISFENLPFFIETSEQLTSVMLRNLAEALGGKVYSVDYEHRKLLHLAAVFACNFTNHMLTAGQEITSKAGFSFDVLEPLIKETISKALENGPDVSQTGPAIRNDQNTIAKHMDLLSFSPELQRIYKEVTQSIIEYYKKTGNGEL
jgi:predicted short-subunit dehydrogenase-like oxidoreductase (DUF2520 family)